MCCFDRTAFFLARQCIRCVTLAFLVLIALCLSPTTGVGQIRGDKALLELVASEWRANIAAIRTWQGKVEYTERIHAKFSKGPKGKEKEAWEDRKTVTQLEFAYDVAANKYVFFATQTQQLPGKDGQRGHKSGRMGWGAIRTSKGYFRVPEWQMDGKENRQRPSLILQTPEAESTGDFSPDFDPMWYFRLSSMDVYDRLMFFHKHADLPSMQTVTVSRERNLVTLTLGKPETGMNKHVFDLDQGSNPVEFANVGSPVLGPETRSFEKVGSIWVPKTATVINLNAETGRLLERSITWIENVLNEPIPEEMFSPETIGIRQRDLVQDARVGVQYRYDAASPPEELDIRKTNWVPYLVAGSVFMVAGTCYLVWRIRRRKPKEFGHAPST